MKLKLEIGKLYEVLEKNTGVWHTATYKGEIGSMGEGLYEDSPDAIGKTGWRVFLRGKNSDRAFIIPPQQLDKRVRAHG
jgi:hypothetical protein